MDLLLHPSTKIELKRILDKTPHALLLVGPIGSGKGTLASYISSQLLEIDIDKLESYPYFRRISELATVSIDDIRELTNFVKLKIPGQKTYKRIIVIEHALAMTIEAQNAYLKLLEEPPLDTVIIMTSSSARELLPTIVSRTAVMTLRRPSETDIKKFFSSKNYDDASINKALILSDGLPGLMNSLLDESNAPQPLILNIAIAKELIGSTQFERLLRVNDLAKQREELPILVVALKKVCKALLGKAIEQNKLTEARKWQATLSELIAKESALNKNPNMKLWLTDLMINL